MTWIKIKDTLYKIELHLDIQWVQIYFTKDMRSPSSSPSQGHRTLQFGTAEDMQAAFDGIERDLKK